MQARDSEPPPQPPGVVKALLSGFNAVAGNVSVIFFPIALDVFLWLGPRLKIFHLFEPYLAQLPPAPPGMESPMTVDPMQLWRGFNLFSFIMRAFPVGIFGLFSFLRPLSADPQAVMENAAIGLTPFGPRLDVEVENIPAVFLLTAGLVLAGWLFGILYFYAVARVALHIEKPPSLARVLLHGLLLNGFWNFALLAFGFPFVLVLALLAMLIPALAVIVPLLAFVLMIWLAVPVFFSAHGIFAGAQNVFLSIWNSFRMMRFGLPPLGWFILMAVIINQGMDLLWSIPPAESWMTLVGIFGHAFISTGLLAASFIFYRDINSWVEAALQWLKTHQVTSARV
jgi:hypothetical protein